MSSVRTFLITGANRGIGKGPAARLLLRSDTIVVAIARDVSKAVEALNSLVKADGSKHIVDKLDSDVDGDLEAVIAQLQNEHAIASLGVTIANAGVAKGGSAVVDTSPQNIRDCNVCRCRKYVLN